MKLKEVRFKNFGNFGNFMASVNFLRVPLTLVLGSNGAGKSFALLDAVHYALYGKPHRNIALGGLVNNINKKDCLVELDFEINGSEYTVRRGQAPNIFEILRDGILIPQNDTTKKYQNYLVEEILKIDSQSFKQIVVLGSANHVPFMQLSTAERRKIVENLLDLGVFTEMNKVLDSKVAENKRSSEQINHQILVLNEKLEIHQRHLLDKSNGKELRLKEYTDTITRSSLKVETSTKNLNKIKKQLEKVKAEYEALGETSDKLIQDLIRYETEANLNTKSANADIDFYSNNASCPKCRQVIPASLKNTQIHECKSTITDMKTALVEIKKDLKAENAKIQAKRDLRDQIRSLETDINREQLNIDVEQRYIAQATAGITKLDNTPEESLDGIRKEIADLQADKVKFDQEKEEILVDQYCMDQMSSLLKDSGIKAKIIKVFIPIINHFINKYLEDMELFAKVTLNEHFMETILARHTEDFSYNSMSEGEKLRVDIAILLTWREIAKRKSALSTNLLILDETFDRAIDEQGLDNAIKLLKKLGETHNIFIISHRASIRNRFDEVMSIRKTGGYSRIEYIDN
jgi:DNA repair exonuclease SbcCD ATPase subunit